MITRLFNLRTYTIAAMFFLLVFGLATMISDKQVYAATAPHFYGNSYFENSQIYWTIAPDALGSSSLGGSVIPNYWGDLKGGYRYDGVASGAIGDEAIGCFWRANGGNGPGGTFDPSCNSITRKGHLYNRLKWDYESGNAWERAGAAEVVNNMLGKPWGSGSRTITDGDWSDLYRRLVLNPNLTMEWRGGGNGYPRRLNTAGVVITAGPGKGQYDSVRYDYGDDTLVDAWEFMYNGRSVMALEIACANGLGDIAGLPEYTPVYDLTPQIDSVSPSPIESGSMATITSHITKQGNTNSRFTQWQINQIVTKPNDTGPANSRGGNRDSTAGPCSFFNVPAARCTAVPGASGTGFYTLDTTPLGFATSQSLDYPVGTQICYALSVQPRNQSSEEWRHSDLVCTIIGIKPKVQVLGSDLMVGRAFAGQTAQASSVNTGITIKNGQTFGSWVEYGIFAPSGIAMASGAGLAGPAGGSPAASEWNKLTFANVAPACPSSAYGCYNNTGTMGIIPDVAGRLMSSGSSALPNPSVTLDALLNGLPDGTYVYNAGNADISIKGNIPKGKSVVIKTNGTVTIDGNITYDSGAIDTIAAIPQLVLLANVIQINEDVDHVDSWLIARSTGIQGTGGVIDTCNVGGFATSLSSGVCNKVLTINGPIMAEKLWLRRTGGSGTGVDSGKPAEILNMRADAYLWALSHAQGNGRVQTVYTQEMAPRF